MVRAHNPGPDLYWFNPLCDLAAGRGALFEPRLAVRALGDDLAMVPALLAVADDIVVVAQRPSDCFLQMLQAAGLQVPELIVWDPLAGGLPDELSARKLTDLRPWGWAPDSVTALTPLAGQLPGGTTHPSLRWHAARRQLYTKTWSAAWLAEIIDDLRVMEGIWICDADVVGTSCGSQKEAAQALTTGFAAGWTRAVIKADFGAAGGQQLIVSAADLAQYQQHWLLRILREAGRVVIEPWLDRQLDLSAQYEVDDSGCLRLLGITRFVTDSRGRFQGVFVHDMAGDLTNEMKRFIYGAGCDDRRLRQLFARIGDSLQARLPPDFRGPLGIDAFVYRDAADGELRLKPIVELNPRFTMGRVALALARRVVAECTAMWRVVRIKDVTAAGYADVATWAAALRQQMPLEMTPDGELISRGIVFTNEPERAHAFVSLLLVGHDPKVIADVTPKLESQAS